MLDTKARKYFDNLFNYSAQVFLNLKLKPNHITFTALIIGVLASFTYYFDYKLLSLVLLWFSGYLDAVDGAMARKIKLISKKGTLLDICFDRVVELLFIVVFALKHESALFALLCLTCSIVMSMSVFLTSGMLMENNSKKSFRYQAGLMERTEGFIMFTAMILFNHIIKELTVLYAVLVLFTAFQRLMEAIKLLGE